ncbi:MAG: phosphatase PAP2 family protein [Chitinophagales bacterium]
MPWNGPAFLGGLRVIHLLQSFHRPWLDGVFLALTLLGSEEFTLLIVPLIYWCFDRRTGRRMGHLFFFSAFLNVWLKAAFHTARPPKSLWRGGGWASASGSAFPSGHTQNAATFWGYLSATAERPWVTAAGLVVVCLVGLSRLYLGVHWPSDVLVGLALGYLVAWAWVRLGTRLREGTESLAPAVRAAAGFLLPLALLAVHRGGDAVKLVAAFSAFAGGSVLAGDRPGPASGTARLLPNVACFLLGVAGTLVVRSGLKPLLPAGALADFLRYWLVGLWVSLIAPWFFGWLWPAANLRNRW